MSAQDSTGSSMAPGAEERRYLKWYNKVGYGSGDVAGNVVYVLLSAFVMIYLTDTAGLNAGVVGTLMMVSASSTASPTSPSARSWTARARGWARPGPGCSGDSSAAPP